MPKIFLTLFCLVSCLNVSYAQTKSVKQGAVNSKFLPITKIDPDESLQPQHPVDPIYPGDPHPVVPGPVDTAYFDPGPFDMIPQAELSKSSNSNTVGSPISSFNVSNLGAATYNIEIETPAGGGLVPHIGLAYNSQNGYGLAGFGFSITGISVITRTGKDLSHDGIQKGLNLAAGDNYCLDGKRLVLVSGIAGSNGSIYSPLGNPRIKVTLHGNDQPSSNLWFEVSDENGIISYFGQSDNSRVIVASGSQQCTMAWYINSSEDIHTNVINFAYVSSNYCLRPSCISYGINRKKNRGISCTISFLYESLGSLAKPFMLGPVTGMIDTKLVGITTSINSQIYRNYSFTYNTSSDNSWSKFARLIKVNVKNKSGQSMSPITIDWNYLPSARVSDQTTNIQTSNSTYLFEETSKNFLACDLNNDGVSDIVKISQVDDYLVRSNKDNGVKNGETWLYVSLSSKKNSSNTYQSPIAVMLPAQKSIDDIQRYVTCQSVIDVDGDGYNDLVLPYFNTGIDTNEAACFVVYGKELVDGSAQCHFIKSFVIPKDCTTPLITTGTFSGNGKNEIFVISDVPDGNNAYSASMLRHTFGNNYDSSLFKLTLPEKPKKIFSGDFNSDGLVDIIFLSESKYTIFYNQGGNESSIKFSDSNSYTGTSFNDKWRFAQGDFNGDGRLDFVYPEGRDLNFALNQGNGNFTIINKVATLDLGDGNSTKDDDKYTLLAFDQDGDGRADVFASNAYYAYHGFPKFKYSFSRGCATWLYSTGTSLVPYKQVEIDRDDDLLQNKIFLGDFDGNGMLEVANYGGSLAGTSVSDYENIRVYATTPCNMAESGKISRITDSFGKSTNIRYLPGTDPSVYQNTVASQYPVIDCTLPLPLVSRVSVDGGAASTQVTNYAYSGLKVQLRGDGILGFAKMTNNNITLGLKNEMVITKWDNKRYIPTEIKQTSSIDNDVTNSVSTITVEERTDNNYFAYNSKKEEYDWDGNPTITTTNYDVDRCLLSDQTISYDKGDTYQTTSYSDYVLKGGVWLPAYVTKTQKHTDDSQTFSIKTAYTYDDNGETLSLTERSNTNMPLSKEFTYDAFGNVLSTVEYGNSVSANIKYTDYDTSGRFVVKASESGSQNYSTYAYDVFGNMISESDCSNPSSILTTNYTYDDWGNKLTAVNPLGCTTKFIRDWGSSSTKKYYVETLPSGKAFNRIWYDACGNKVMVESVGREQSYIVSYTYNDKGLVSQIVTKKGLLSVTESFDYDNHNRILSDNLSTGKLTTYVYNNRIVTSTSSGRTYTTETDALGNIIRSTDPLGHDVEYTYCSNGKPGKITANGISTLFEYDNSGNQTSIIDPDAGKTIYTYAADGKILTQTDSRGIKTVNTYDVIGRVTSTMVGNTIVNYTYGTSGNAAMQLVKSSMNDNSIEYEYDQYGRKTKETRTVADHGSYTFDYAYNTLGQLSSVTFPGNLVVTYGYNNSGFLTSTKAGLDKVYSLVYDNGKSYRYCFKDKVCATSQYDDRGYLTESNLIAHDATSDELTSSSDAITVYDKITSEYQSTTGNLTSRQRFGQNAETFEYDNLDRLTKVYKGGSLAMQMTYDASGNITSKTSIGAYTYNTLLPHAVAAVENSSLLIPLNALSTSYNDINKISTINGGSDSMMTFTYGPDNQRWYTQIVHNGNIVRSTVYADSYEKVVDNGIMREYYYLDGNTIVIKENGTFKSYIALTDNQRNILSVIDENGTKHFDSDYDPWGKQTIRINTIGLHRGYTGHEMLNEFGIINMNGRLYDPLLGRFFSPDNYVQECDNLQNFNRYSYCLNNPLKLIDPTGNLFGIDDAIIFGVVSGAMMGAMNAAMHNDKIWAGALVGGVVGGLTGWTSGAMASFSQANNVWAGALVGAGTGASIGAASSFLSVGFNNLLNGRNFSENLWSSVGSSAFTGGVTGAISGGIKAYESCRERNINPFTGESNRESFSNIVEGHMQPDPSRGCYEYAGEYASEQVGKPHTAESIGAACDNADGMDVAHAWDKMQCGIKYARYSTFLKDTDLSQFAGAFDRGKMTAELTISTSSSGTNHVVTLNKFDTVIKHSWFGTGMHTVMSRIHVFDPLTGNTERFYGHLKMFDLIH